LRDLLHCNPSYLCLVTQYGLMAADLGGAVWTNPAREGWVTLVGQPAGGTLS